MVSALFRKENDSNITKPVQLTYVPWHSRTTKQKDNFPYALREFVNSHTNWPTLNEIFSKKDVLVYNLKMGR